MTRTWWVKRLFGAPNRPARRSRPTLLTLEDRTAPAVLTEADAGKSLVITLNEAGEALTIASAGATYNFITTGTKFSNGGVTAPGDFAGIDTQNLTLQATGLTRYDTVRVVDTAAGAKVTFADSGANKYADQFDVTLDNTSAGIVFNLASDYDTKAAQLVTDATLTVSSGATVRGTGGLTVRANAIAIDTSGAPGTVNAGGGTVTLTPFTAGNTIDLGGADAAGTLGLTDAELDRVTAGLLRVGDAAAGAISVTGQITPAGTTTLALTSGGAISNSAADKGVQVANLALRGGSVDLSTSTFNAVTTLAGASTAAGGGFAFRYGATALTVGLVDTETGITTAGGAINVVTIAGTLTVSRPVAAGTAAINLVAGGAAGIVNQSAISNSGGNLIILMADAQDLQPGSTITAASGTANLRPAFFGTSADLGSAAAGLNFSGTELDTITAATLRITATANITVSESITLSAAKVATLSLDAIGAVTQAAGKVLTVSNLAATGTSVALDTAAHAVATVAGRAMAGDFAFNGGNSPGLTVGTVDSVAGVTATGQVTIRSANDLTVSAPVQAGTTIALTVADGNPAGRTATVPGSLLTAPNGTTITGGAGSDTFNISASANSTIDVNGGLPSAPASPGDTLTIDAQGNPATVNYQGSDLTKGSVQVAALKAIAFQEIETRAVVNSPAAETVLDGLAGNDVLVLSKVGGAVVFTFNGSAPVPVIGTKFTFNGLAGDDRMLVDFSGGDPALADGITFNGGNNTDTLQVKAAGLVGSYRPSGVDSGTVTVGTQKIAFATAEQADATGAGKFAVFFPGADDTLTVANGKDFGSNTIDALVVSSPAAAFAPVALWSNGQVVIDTADAGGLDGNDTVTITSANNAHANFDVRVRTGTGTDTVTVNGPVNLAGSIKVDSVAVAVNANITAGGVALTHTGLLQLGAVTVSGTGGVSENGGGPVTLTGDVTAQSASSGVIFFGAIDATVAGGQSLTVTGATSVAFNGSVGQTTRLKAVNVTGASISFAGAAYKTQLGQTYTGAVTVAAPVVLFDAAAGAITFAGALDGSAVVTPAVTVAAGGAATFGGPVGATVALTSLTVGAPSAAVNGGLVQTSGGQTYNAPVTVGQDTTFTSTGGGVITFNGTLSGGFAVAVNTAGQGTFAKAVTVGSLSTDLGGTTQVNGGSVTTTGGQGYADAVTVGANTTFAAGGVIGFGGSLNGGFAVAVNTTGATGFFGPVGDVAPLASLTTNVGGTTQINGGLVQTSGGQTFNDPVRVGADATFASTGGGAVLFNVTLDGPGGATVATAGTTTFTGAVGGVAPLAFLSTGAGGTTQVNGGSVTTAGDQTYGDGVTVAVNTLFAAGGGVTFASTLTGAGLAVTVNAAGTTTFAGAVNVGALTTNGPGATALSTTDVTAAGALSFNNAVLLQAPGGGVTTVTSTGNAAVTFAAVDGPGGLAVVTGGKTTFAGPVGETTSLASLSTVGGGATVVGGGLVRTAGVQGYGDAVVLAADADFTSGALVHFEQTLTGAFAAVTNSPQVTFRQAVDVGRLTVNAAAGPVVGVNVNGPTVGATLGQSYALPVTATGSVSFVSAAGDVAFGQSLGGAFAVSVLTPGTATFGGPVSVAALATDAGGTTVVRGGAITTSGGQQFNDAVVVADQNAAFTSTGGGNVVFGAALSGGFGVAVNTAGTSRFDGPVNLAALATDAGGTTVFNTGLVQTLGSQSFGDAVGVNVPVTFRAGGNAVFGSTLSGPVGVEVQSPGTTVFGGPVDLAALATDAPGQTEIDGGSVVTGGGQSYGDPVGVGADTTFTSVGGAGVVFGQALAGPGRTVAVNTAGATTFAGAVRVGSLTTDAAGATAVNGGSVVTDGSQTFLDPVTVGAAATFAAGGDVLFGQALSGAVAVAVAAPGATTFGGQVNLASLATDVAGSTVVNTSLVQTTGGQVFGDAVGVNVAATFAGGAITFGSFLTSGLPVGLASGGAVTFFAPVTVGSLTTDAGGRTVVRGGSVQTNAGQSYGDDVLLGVSSGLGTAAGDLSFLGRVDAESAGAQGLTAAAPAGNLLFAGAVGSAGSIAFLTADAVQTTFAAVFRTTGDVELTAHGGGAKQTGGFLTAAALGLLGSGTFSLNQLGDGNSGNDIDTFRAKLTAGTIQLADRDDLTIDPVEGVVTANGAVTIRTGGDFTAAGAGTLVNLGKAAVFVVEPGQFTKAQVTLQAEIVATKAVFGVFGDLGPNDDDDSFSILPSANTPIQVNGNAPTVAPGDSLTPNLAGLIVTGFNYNGQNGFYEFTNRKKLEFNGIEDLKDLALTGFVVQTGEPGDVNNPAQINFAVRIVQSQQGRQLPGGLDGETPVQNPFVVSPAFVNPAAPSAAPRIAFGDVNGDRQVDVILASGPGTSPLITVINGDKILNLENGQLPDLGQLRITKDILAEFFAYDPRFFGGVNVAVADLNQDGFAEIITGADIGGGPHVRVFDGATVKDNADPREVDGFFAYEPKFTGGVRVAAGDVNGDGRPDLVLGAGVGGGPRVTVVDGKQVAERQGGAARGGTTRGVNPAAVLANFFAYDTAFRGGIFVDAGDFDDDGFADVLTGPGVGGGPHVRVFDGKTAPTGSPTVLANFIALDPPPDPLFGVATPKNGVGGVAFTGRGNNDLRNVVVGSARGTPVEVIEYELSRDPATEPQEFAVLDPQGLFIVPNPSDSQQPRAIFPLPVLLGYGATVGGFLDESDG